MKEKILTTFNYQYGGEVLSETDEEIVLFDDKTKRRVTLKKSVVAVREELS